MEEPEIVVTRVVRVDENGTRRLVEERRKVGPDGRATWFELRTSRPIREGESPEQAAADSLAFTDQHFEYSSHSLYRGPPGVGGFSAYGTDLPDGSRRYQSFARPDLASRLTPDTAPPARDRA